MRLANEIKIHVGNLFSSSDPCRGRYRISERGGPGNCSVLKRGVFVRMLATFLKFGGPPKGGVLTPGFPPLDPPLPCVKHTIPKAKVTDIRDPTDIVMLYIGGMNDIRGTLCLGINK